MKELIKTRVKLTAIGCKWWIVIFHRRTECNVDAFEKLLLMQSLYAGIFMLNLPITITLSA